MSGATSGATRLVVRPDQIHLRLDQFLADATGLSRRRSRALIGEGAAWRNGRPTRVQSKPIDAGDIVDLLVPEDQLVRSPWRPEPVNFVHDDSWMAVADKPAGVLSQPAGGSNPEDLALDERALLALALREGHRPYLRMIHRIDRLTSGLVVFARSKKAVTNLTQSWQKNHVRRFYLAVITGTPNWEHQEIDEPIARDTGTTWRFKVDSRGRPAQTSVRLLGQHDSDSVVLCELGTGRTHQVRVHLAHLGHPVVGDGLYGGAAAGVPHPLLLAWALQIPHPKNGKELRLTAEIPAPLAARLPPEHPKPPWTK